MIDAIKISSILDVSLTDVEGCLAVRFKGDGSNYIFTHYLVDGDTYGNSPTLRQWISDNNPTILPFVPAEPELELIPVEISRRQFFQQLAIMNIITKAEAVASLTSGLIPAPLQTIIEHLPTEDDKFEAQMLVIGAQSFNRSHPLSEIVRQAMQWTVEQKCNFWLDASKL